MRISGTADLAAPPGRVFEALHDPGVLAATIPGVQSLHRVADDRYRMTVTAGVASVKGAYTGEVALCDQRPPHSFTLRANASGAPGTVDATVRVTLEDHGQGTRLAYDADAVVGGMVGGVGQRMLASVARRMAGQFFGAVDRVIAEGLPGDSAAVTVTGDDTGPAHDRVAAAAAPAHAVSGPSTVEATGTAVGPPSWQGDPDDGRVPFWVVLAGVGAGAFWALAGVGVGYAIARGQRR